MYANLFVHVCESFLQLVLAIKSIMFHLSSPLHKFNKSNYAVSQFSKIKCLFQFNLLHHEDKFDCCLKLIYCRVDPGTK